MFKKMLMLSILSLTGLTAKAAPSASQAYALSMNVNRIECSTRTVSCTMMDNSGSLDFSQGTAINSFDQIAGKIVNIGIIPTCTVEYTCSNGQTYNYIASFPAGAHSSFTGDDTVAVTVKAVSSNSGLDLLTAGNKGQLSSTTDSTSKIPYSASIVSSSNGNQVQNGTNVSIGLTTEAPTAPSNGSFSDILTVTISGQ